MAGTRRLLSFFVLSLLAFHFMLAIISVNSIFGVRIKRCVFIVPNRFSGADDDNDAPAIIVQANSNCHFFPWLVRNPHEFIIIVFSPSQSHSPSPFRCTFFSCLRSALPHFMYVSARARLSIERKSSRQKQPSWALQWIGRCVCAKL